MFVKLFADAGLVAVLVWGAVAGAVWLWRTRPKLAVVLPYAIMAGLTSLLIGKLLSLLPVQHARPFVEKGAVAGAAYIDNPGFPSDHALLAVVVVMAVFFLTPYKKSAYGMLLLTLVMCVARVVALVHTPFDIAGGLVAGAAGAVWYFGHRPVRAGVSRTKS